MSTFLFGLLHFHVLFDLLRDKCLATMLCHTSMSYKQIISKYPPNTCIVKFILLNVNTCTTHQFPQSKHFSLLWYTAYLKVASLFSNCTNYFQNVTSDHKSRNAHASLYDFSFIIKITLKKITPSLCFHSNLHIVLNNLFMHLSLTNQKHDILLSIL